METEAKPYNMKGQFTVGEVINHKVLGDGEVIDRWEDEDCSYILVQFKYHRKKLVCDYKD